MRLKIFLTLIVFLFLLLSPSKTFALTNFSTDYDATYQVSENGLTNVTLKAPLTNNTSQYFASSYKIRVGFKNITNLKISDDNGAIDPKIEQTPQGSLIDVNFNERVVGIGKSQNFVVTFTTDEVASVVGKAFEINVPGISNENDFDTFDVELIIPKNLGRSSYIKPNSVKPRVLGNSIRLTKKDLTDSRVLIGFGNEQIYKYRLLYQLKNDNIFAVKTDIALPPNTTYQETILESINPKPVNIYKDRDGNFLATYHLSPAQEINVVVEGVARVGLTPKKEVLSTQDYDLYLRKQPYWQIDNEKIKSLAEKLKTPEKIYDYVSTKLTYDISRVKNKQERAGALNALKNPQSAVCLEYTDLFIALSRAAGIPAREVNGYAFTNNESDRPLSLVKDVLHAWPQYYDLEKQTWVMVDPTWGNTTGGLDYFNEFDFNHFAFVIKGLNSEYPIPAGGYRSSDEEKSVLVEPADVFMRSEPELTVDLIAKNENLLGTKVRTEIVVKNLGNSASTPKTLYVNSTSLNPSNQSLMIPVIPYQGSFSETIYFDKKNLLTYTNVPIKISFDGKTIVKDFAVKPVFLKSRFIGGVLIGILTITAVIATAIIWRLRFYRRG